MMSWCTSAMRRSVLRLRRLSQRGAWFRRLLASYLNLLLERDARLHGITPSRGTRLHDGSEGGSTGKPVRAVDVESGSVRFAPSLPRVRLRQLHLGPEDVGDNPLERVHSDSR